jgi:hypothetical protein
MVLRDFGSLLTLVFALGSVLFILVGIIFVVVTNSIDLMVFLLDGSLARNLV